MQIKVIVATWLFALTAFAIIGLSQRQLAATKQSDRKIAVAVGVSSIFEALNAQATLDAGETSLDDVVLDGRSYKRSLRVKETADGTSLDVTLTLVEKGKPSRPLVYATSFAKK